TGKAFSGSDMPALRAGAAGMQPELDANMGTWQASHRQLYEYRLPDALLVAEYLEVSLDLGGLAGGLLRIVGKLHGRAAVRAGDLADERDGLQPVYVARRAALEIIGEVGAPAEGHAHLAPEMMIGFQDGVHIEPV